jgi:hypothetical protein
MNELSSIWNGKIFYFVNKSDFNFTNLLNIYPDKSKVQFYFFFSVLLCIVLSLTYHRLNPFINRLVILFSAILAQTGFYIRNLGYIDEVYVNLIHPFNLYHHGKYSFQADSFIDGTVEYIYYLLLTPFSSTRESLLIASFVLGWAIAVGHIIMIARLFQRENLFIYIIGLFLTAFHFDLNRIFSSGFGNGLVSLLFLYAWSAWTDSKPKRAIIISSILPLFRIDAFLYSLVLITLVFLKYRVIKHIFIGLICSLLSIACTMLFSLYYYGHMVPTPIAFKSVPIHFLLQQAHRFPIALLTNFVMSYGTLLFIIFSMSYFCRLLNREQGFAAFSYIILLFISAIYTVQSRVNEPNRYFLPIYLVEIILITNCISCLTRKFELDLGLNTRKRQVQIIGFVILALLNLQAGIQSRRFSILGVDPSIPVPFDGLVYRTFKIAQEAEALNSILPKTDIVASTELNTLGFFGNFKIDPLWGYANRQIAKSNQLMPFAGGIRALPNYVINSKPDYFWLHFVPKEPENHLIDDDLDGDWYQCAPKIALSSIIDLAQEFPYVFYIRTGTLNTCLLVPERSLNSIQNLLKQNGYSSSFQRPLNYQSIKASDTKYPLQMMNY